MAIVPQSLPTQQPSATKSTHGNDLLAQAARYHSEGEFDYAITAFGALIADPDVPRNIRDQARKGRGGSYLAKGTAESINRAIIDFKAAKEPGIQLSVMRSEAELRDAKIVTGKVHRNESVLLTQSKGDWLWVESVQGNKSRQGWIKCSAFLAVPTQRDGPAVSVVKPNLNETKPSNTVASTSPSNFQPGSSVAGKSEPTVQPFGSSPLQITPTASGSSAALATSVPSALPSSSTMLSFGPDGQPIGTLPSRTSQPTSLPSQQFSGQQVVFDQYGNQVRQTTQVPANQTQQASSTRQMQTYQVDQYGNRISVQPTQQYSSARQPANNQPSNMVYFDQNGRQINPSNVQTQRQYNGNQPQASQQQVYRPQQQTYQTQQQTYQQQPSNKIGFGNQSRPIFQPQNQGGKILQSPMRSHMQRMKSFGFGN